MTSKFASSIYHFCYSSLHQTFRIWSTLKSSLQWLEYFVEDFFNGKLSKKSIIQLKLETAMIKKPNHIAYIFPDAKILEQKIEDVTKLVIFTMACSIKFITIFSPDGKDITINYLYYL